MIEGLHRTGVEFRSLVEGSATATATDTDKLQLSIVLAFSEWLRNSIRERSVASQAMARTEGRFPDRAATGVPPGGPKLDFVHLSRVGKRIHEAVV